MACISIQENVKKWAGPDREKTDYVSHEYTCPFVQFDD